MWQRARVQGEVKNWGQGCNWSTTPTSFMSRHTEELTAFIRPTHGLQQPQALIPLRAERSNTSAHLLPTKTHSSQDITGKLCLDHSNDFQSGGRKAKALRSDFFSCVILIMKTKNYYLTFKGHSYVSPLLSDLVWAGHRAPPLQHQHLFLQ